MERGTSEEVLVSRGKCKVASSVQKSSFSQPAKGSTWVSPRLSRERKGRRERPQWKRCFSVAVGVGSTKEELPPGPSQQRRVPSYHPHLADEEKEGRKRHP